MIHGDFQFASADQELWSLTESLCDGSISPDQLETLESLLRDDEQARLFFASYMDVHGRLLWRFRSGGQVVPGMVVNAVEPSDQLECESPQLSGIKLFTDSSLSTTHYRLSTNFVGGPIFSYMVATLVLCMMLLGAWAYKVTLDAPIATNAPAPSLIEKDSQYVARITGMKDCRCSANAIVPMVGLYVPLGRKYSLDAGLLEITYESGARVILEGPCIYTVDSDAGGRLQLGKLVARVENRGGLAASATSAKPQAVPSQPLAPLFTITTPTAVVTDLGTEFGVEVSESGETASHVFRGSVKVAPLEGGSDSVVLGANESVRVVKQSGDRKAIVARGNPAKPPRFIRYIPRLKRGYLDLADIVAGGDGFGRGRGRGIDAVDGRLIDSLPLKYGQAPTGDDRYHPVEELPMVDGVFVPDGGGGLVQITSVGHKFKKFPDTSARSWSYIWAGQITHELKPSLVVSCWLNFVDYTDLRRSVICMPSNKGITFDLTAIRRAHPGVEIARFTTVAGNTEKRSDNRLAKRVSADIWVFVDGVARFSRKDVNSLDGGFQIDMPLTADDRFLTLAATDAGNTGNFDWIIFGDPHLEIRLNKPSTK